MIMSSGVAIMGSKVGSVGERLLTTEIFSVRTDIPSTMVLCALPRASCGQRCLLRSHKGELTLPPSMPTASTPIVYLRFKHIQGTDMSENASLPVSTHHGMRGGDAYGGKNG